MLPFVGFGTYKKSTPCSQLVKSAGIMQMGRIYPALYEFVWVTHAHRPNVWTLTLRIDYDTGHDWIYGQIIGKKSKHKGWCYGYKWSTKNSYGRTISQPPSEKSLLYDACAPIVVPGKGPVFEFRTNVMEEALETAMREAWAAINWHSSQCELLGILDHMPLVYKQTHYKDFLLWIKQNLGIPAYGVNNEN